MIILQVGGLLDSKGYGIASRKGLPYKALLDHAILKLLEGGNLHKLKVFIKKPIFIFIFIYW